MGEAMRRLIAGVAVSAVLAVGAFAALSGGAPDGAGTRTPTPTATPPKVRHSRHPRPVTVVWGGDVTLGSQYGLPPDRGRPLLAGIARTLRDGHLTAVNYEGTFATPGLASKCEHTKPGDCYAFAAPAANAKTLRHFGVDIVNQANNHAFDYGPLGWHATRVALKRAKVKSTGAPGEIVVMTRNHTRIALVGFSTYPWSGKMDDPERVRVNVTYAARVADIVVVFMHAGAEGAEQTRVPLGAETAFGESRGNSRVFARAAIDAGADLVLGSGPHVLRGVERYKGRLIAYSLGDLAGWKNFGTKGVTGLSGLLTVRLAASGRMRSARLTALRLDANGVPRRDSTEASVRLVKSLTRSDFSGGGVRITRHGTITPARRG
jgi:hypothetical protein